MMEFSNYWKSSTQPRKQRKYNYNAPLHVRQKKMHVHLSKPLQQKYHFRNIQVRKGDQVKIVRGGFGGQEGKVEQVLLKREKVLVSGAEITKKDGSKKFYPLHPSNLVLTELSLTDQRRKSKLESKKISLKI